MARMLADGKITMLLLDEWPKDPKKATVADLADAQDASCVVGKSGFGIGAGTPNTEDDTPLCTEGETTIPVSKTYEATMNVYRYFDKDGQIDEEEDFFFQALKEFGSEVPVAVRDGGKTHDQPPEAGDEWSFYKLISGGMGRATDAAGYSKRVAHVSVVEAEEDVTISGDESGE